MDLLDRVLPGGEYLDIRLGLVQDEVDPLNSTNKLAHPVADLVVGDVTGQRHHAVINLDPDFADPRVLGQQLLQLCWTESSLTVSGPRSDPSPRRRLPRDCPRSGRDPIPGRAFGFLCVPFGMTKAGACASAIVPAGKGTRVCPDKNSWSLRESLTKPAPARSLGTPRYRHSVPVEDRPVEFVMLDHCRCGLENVSAFQTPSNSLGLH